MNSILNESDRCIICGKHLVSIIDTADHKKINCNFCGKSFDANIFCPDGHYICDSCHSKGATEIIKDFCLKTNLKDPYEIAEIIMNHPAFHMYGPEHHILVPTVILAALRNNLREIQKGTIVSQNDIEEAIRRSSKIPGGWCGFYGSCGAAIGSGVTISIFTNATPSTSIIRSIANKTTSQSLGKIADNLEHCCKRSVRLSIETALNILKEELDINLDYKHGHCTFSQKNEKCVGNKCPIY